MHGTEVATDEASVLRTRLDGSLAVVTLDRPRALNALTTAMRTCLSAALWAYARDPQVYAVVIESASDRAFCAGSDAREIAGWGGDDPARARTAFRDEYALNWQCECFSKPTVSLIDGMVMGGGVGVTLYGTHRIGGENYRFAMPETAIGLFPDVGVCHALARMPWCTGLYLGLTGAGIGRADAYDLGLLTHCIDRAQFPEIEAGLADTWPVDTILDERHTEPGAPELERHREAMMHCFSAPTVEDIVARLEAWKGAASHEWTRATAAELRRRSPTALKITLRHIREAARYGLDETLAIDFRLACRALEGHDFREGVRARLVDKDGAPAWQPPRLEDVTEEMVAAAFAPLADGDELRLPTRADMQAARA